LTANRPGSLNAMTSQRLVAVVLIGALLLLTGCTSMRSVRVATAAEPTYGEVKPGDKWGQGTYRTDGRATSWLKIKNPHYSQMRDRHELFGPRMGPTTFRNRERLALVLS
jgi:hypothetical protein